MRQPSQVAVLFGPVVSTEVPAWSLSTIPTAASHRVSVELLRQARIIDDRVYFVRSYHYSYHYSYQLPLPATGYPHLPPTTWSSLFVRVRVFAPGSQSAARAFRDLTAYDRRLLGARAGRRRRAPGGRFVPPAAVLGKTTLPVTLEVMILTPLCRAWPEKAPIVPDCVSHYQITPAEPCALPGSAEDAGAPQLRWKWSFGNRRRARLVVSAFRDGASRVLPHRQSAERFGRAQRPRKADLIPTCAACRPRRLRHRPGANQWRAAKSLVLAVPPIGIGAGPAAMVKCCEFGSARPARQIPPSRRIRESRHVIVEAARRSSPRAATSQTLRNDDSIGGRARA